MPQGNLVALVFLGNLKQGFPPGPRAEETGRFTSVCGCVELGFMQDERNVVPGSATSQIVLVGMIRDILHDNVCDHQLELGLEYFRPPSQELNQCQRVFPSRQSNQYFVSIPDLAIITDGLPDFVFYFDKQ